MRSPDPRRQLVDRCEAAIQDENRRRREAEKRFSRKLFGHTGAYIARFSSMSDREKIELILEIQEGKVR